MNEFLRLLSEAYKDDYILLCLDNAAWHKSKALIVPDNIVPYHLLAYTPEMNVIEPVWKEVHKDGFKNTLLNTLSDVVDKLSNSLISFTKNVIQSVCGTEWISLMFEGGVI